MKKECVFGKINDRGSCNQWRINLKMINKDGKTIVDEGMIGNYYDGDEESAIKFLQGFISIHINKGCKCVSE